MGCYVVAEVLPWRNHGVCGGGAPAHVVLVAGVAYGLGFVAQQKRKVTRMLTEGSGRSEMPRRGVDGEVG